MRNSQFFVVASDLVVHLKVFVPFINDEEREKHFLEMDRMDMDNHLDVDGKYESESLEFLYKPSDSPFEMQMLNTELFFSRPNEQIEFVNDISNQARSNLTRRQEELNLGLSNNRNSEYINNQFFTDLNDNFNTEEKIDLDYLN
jgi:hypothetical protein